MALAAGAVVSERFELGRNFCNKLWNASRFALMNLEGYTPAPVADDELAVEDRWILSRLATVTAESPRRWSSYHYADAARTLYDFAWDEFCSFYVEMIKARLQDPAARPTAQRVLAHTLDTLLRLLHPMIAVHHRRSLAAAGCRRRRSAVLDRTRSQAAESIMIAPWPEADAARQDAADRSPLCRAFRKCSSGLREIRSRQNIPPKTRCEFSVRCDAGNGRTVTSRWSRYFDVDGRRQGDRPGAESPAPPTSRAVSWPRRLEVFVDLAGAYRCRRPRLRRKTRS